jgi:hypothetical protein
MLYRFLLKLFIKKYLKISHPENIALIKKDGSFTVGNKPITEMQSRTYREAAEVLKTNAWLKVVLSTLRSHAEKQIMYKGTDFEIVKNNRMILYTVGEIERLIELPIFFDKAKDNYTSQDL